MMLRQAQQPKQHSSLSLSKGQEQSIRSHWDDEQEQWYFSVIDVVAVLTDSANPRDYWYKMKIRVKGEEGFEPSTVCRQFKMKSSDGKQRLTDCADTEGVLRIIQSIPSPKAEPFKQWLAQVGTERIEETEDPELAFDRAMQTYLAKGYSKEWINQASTGSATTIMLRPLNLSKWQKPEALTC